MQNKNLSKLERLAVQPLEQDIAAIENDRAHYQKLLDSIPERIEDAKRRHVAIVTTNLRDAGVLAADEHVDAFTVTNGKVTSVEVVTTAELDARAKAKADADAAKTAAAKASEPPLVAKDVSK